MATPSVDAMYVLVAASSVWAARFVTGRTDRLATAHRSVAGYSVAAPSTSPRLRQGARARKRPPSSASLFSQRGRLMSPSEVSEEPSMLFDCGTGVVWTLHGIREVMREKLMQHTRARSQFRQAITCVVAQLLRLLLK